MNRRAMIELRRQQRNKPKLVKPEFTAKKKYKFWFFRKWDKIVGVKVVTTLPSRDTEGQKDFNHKTIEELLEESVYDTSAEHLTLTRQEFNKLEKFLTPLPPNVSVEE